MRWLISIPVWGERYRKTFVDFGLPSIIGALSWAGLNETDVRFLVHTDMPGFLDGRLRGFDVTYFPVPQGANSSLAIGNATRAAFKFAEIGECVCVYNADIVISREAFAACGRRLEQGKRFIQCHSVRTVASTPPIGEWSRDLLAWGWGHRHVWVDECVYGRGRCNQPAIVIFEEGDDVVAHCFSLLPFAVYKDREIPFTGPTLDELPDAFTPSETHIVTSADEMAAVEVCPPGIPYTLGRRVVGDRVIRHFGPMYATPMMYWQFAQQIVIKGKRNERAQAIVDDEILAKLDCTRNPARLAPFGYTRIVGMSGLVRLWLRIPERFRHKIPEEVRREVLLWL